MASDDRLDQVLSAFIDHRAQLESLIHRRVRCRGTAADLVQDLFDKYYVSQCTSGSRCTLGHRRTIIAALIYRW